MIIPVKGPVDQWKIARFASGRPWVQNKPFSRKGLSQKELRFTALRSLPKAPGNPTRSIIIGVKIPEFHGYP